MALPERLAAELRARPAERLVVALLREALAPVPVYTQLPAKPSDPHFILVRRVPGGGAQDRLARQVSDSARCRISTYAAGPDAVRDAQDLALLVEQALGEGDGNAYSKPDLGTLVRVDLLTDATHAPGWEDAPADYSSLPGDVARYGATYLAVTRLPI